MINKALFSLVLFLPIFCMAQINSEIKKINVLLDQWHEAAANAHYEPYFAAMTNEAVFIGTDATENWDKKEFQEFSKPYFDKGKAWAFTSVDRNIYIAPTGDFAWFDELLDTRMKICRGSGVIIKEDGVWKIAHYVLSIAVPNDLVDELILLKTENDSILLHQLKTNK